MRGSVGTRRVGERCGTPQGSQGTCQYIFASQCRYEGRHLASRHLSLQAHSDGHLDTRGDHPDLRLPSKGTLQHSAISDHVIQAIRAPCGFASFDFTLCCQDSNLPPATTQPTTTQPPTTPQPTTTQRPTTQVTTQRPTNPTTTQAPLTDTCGTKSGQKIVGGIEAR